MSSLLLKRSNTAGAIPSAVDLTNSTNGADVAINTADKRLFVKNGSGVVVEVGTTPSTFVAPSGTTASRPVSPVVGQMYFNTTTNDLEEYTGSAWVSAGASSVTAAASSASAAATSASNAATSASNASTSASAADTAKVAAQAAQTGAETAKTAAEAALAATLTAYDNFDDRYLGAKASDPTVDNDGNALVAGTLYFNSNTGVMMLYTGSAWVAAYVSGGSYATLTGTETLTNKTITYASNTLTGVQPTLVSGTSIKTINGSSLLGSGDITITTASTITQRNITGTDTLIASDQGKLINASGTFTLSVTAAATLGAGWYCWLRNTGTGTVTLDPNGSETVDGVTSGPVRDTILLVCDGTGFTAMKIGPSTTTQLLTSGTSWTCPLGVRRARLRMVGGGGGGGNQSASDRYGTGGSGGGYCEASVLLNPGTAYTYAIGSGGVGATTSNTAGGAGGNTTFTANGVTYTAGGGAGGVSGGGAVFGGTGTNGDINLYGLPGYVEGGQYKQSKGGDSMLGQGQIDVGFSTSYMGYGGGSSGGSTSSSCDNGKQGCIVLEY